MGHRPIRATRAHRVLLDRVLQDRLNPDHSPHADVPTLVAGLAVLIAVLLFHSGGLVATPIAGGPVFGSALRQQNSEPFAMEVIGQLGASPFSVSAERQRVFVGAGQRIKVVDVSDPDDPRFLGESDYFPDRVESVLYNEGFLYAGAERGLLHVVDGRELRAPRRGIDVDLPSQEVVREMAVRGDLLAAVTSDATLHLFEISNPAEPLLLRSVSAGGSSWWPDTGAGTTGLLLQEQLAFVRDVSGVTIIDITDRHRPKRVSRYERPVMQYTRGMGIVDNRLYVATTTEIRTVDISNPRRPRQVASLLNLEMSSGLPIRRMQAEGDRIYVVQEGARRWNHDEGDPRLVQDPGLIVVLDASDPGVPSTLAQHPLPLQRPEFDIAFGKFWMADEGVGLTGLDLTDATDATSLGFLAAEHHYGVSSRGELTAVIVGQPDVRERRLDLVDSSDPAAMTVVGAVDQIGRAQDVLLDGDRAYLRSMRQISVVDLQEAITPTLRGSSGDLGRIVDMAVSAERAFVIDADAKGLRVLDVSDPGQIRETVSLTTTEEPTALVVGGGRAYVASDSGVDAYDIRSPDRPSWLGHVQVLSTSDPNAYPGPRPVGPITDLLLRDAKLYILGSTTGVVVYDLTNMNAPKHLGNVEHRGGGWLRLDDTGRAHILDQDQNNGSWTYTTYPALLTEERSTLPLHQLSSGGAAQGLDGIEDRAYAALGPLGLAVLAPVPPEGLILTRTPRASATAPALPTATLRPGAAARPFLAYLPKLEQPVARSRKPLTFALERIEGGPTQLTAVEGDRIFLSEGKTLKVLDNRNSAAIEELSSTQLPIDDIEIRYRQGPEDLYAILPAAPLDIHARGDRLYVMTGLVNRQISWAAEFLYPQDATLAPSLAQLLTYDVSDPSRLLLLDRMTVDGVAYDMVLNQDHLYLSLFTESDEHLVTKGRIDVLKLDADGLPSVSGSLPLPGFMLAVRHQGDRMLGIMFGSELDFQLVTMDVSTRQLPSILGSVRSDFYSFDSRPAIAFNESEAYVFSAWDKAERFDIADPSDPRLEDAFYLQEILWEDEVEGNDIETVTDALMIEDRLVLLDRFNSGRLVSLDLEPLRPAPSGHLDLGVVSDLKSEPGYWEGQPWALDGDRLLLAGGDAGGLAMVDVSRLPKELPGFATVGSVVQPIALANSIVTQNTLLGLSVWDGMRLPKFAEVGRVEARSSVSDYSVEGDRAYLVGSFRSSMQWLDTSNPSTPLSGGLDLTSPTTRRIDGQGDMAYVVEESGGLLALQIRDPGDAEIMGQYFGPGILRDVDVQGQYAYLASGPAGVGVIDVQDPAAIHEAGHLDTSLDARMILVDGDRGYLIEVVSSREHQLSVLDLSDPVSPAILSSMPLGVSVKGSPQLVGDLLFISHPGGMLAIDISQPERPSVAGELPDEGGPLAVGPDGRWLLISRESGQVALYRIERD